MPEQPTSKHREIPEFLRVPWGLRDVVIVIVVWVLIQAMLILTLGILGEYVPAVKGFLEQVSTSQAAASFVFDMAGIVIGLAIVAVVLRHYKVTWRAVGWRKVSVLKLIKYLAVILVVFVVLVNVALIVVKLLLPQFDINQPQTNALTGSTQSHPLLALIALVVMPPIFEETIFRGFIFPALAKRAGLIWGAVLSSLLFGLAHGQPNLFVYTSILGLLLCFMYVRTKSIVPGIFLHMLNNYLAFLAISSK